MDSGRIAREMIYRKMTENDGRWTPRTSGFAKEPGKAGGDKAGPQPKSTEHSRAPLASPHPGGLCACPTAPGDTPPPLGTTGVDCPHSWLLCVFFLFCYWHTEIQIDPISSHCGELPVIFSKLLVLSFFAPSVLSENNVASFQSPDENTQVAGPRSYT